VSCLACVIAVLGAGSASAETVVVRPQRTASVSNVANPANALDDNAATFAAIAIRRVCRDDLQKASGGTLTFEGFPRGYKPARVEVSWSASAILALMQENKARVTARIEYSDGDKWRPVETASWGSSSKICPMMSDGGVTCFDHRAAIALPPGLASDRIRVRVALQAFFTACTPSGPSGTANLAANAKIYDVRMVAEKLQARPHTPQPGAKRNSAKTP
jgi:hypothetical protein